MKTTLLPVACFGFALASASAGTVSISGPLTTDASSGISTSNTYTHAIAGSRATTVNGVNFQLLNATTTPANFNWVSTGGKNEIVGNLNTWVPANGGVVGPGLHSAGLTGLLDSFTYAGAGADPGGSQTFTLSGLIVGTTYDARLYIRSWDSGGSGRPIALTFTNGAEVDPAPVSPEDRPGTILGTGNQDQALYVNYRYTALTSDLIINAAVPAGSPVGSGSFHMFGVTNQVIPEPCTAASLVLALGLFAGARRRRA
jgi:hypothetical protein